MKILSFIKRRGAVFLTSTIFFCCLSSLFAAHTVSFPSHSYYSTLKYAFRSLFCNTPFDFFISILTSSNCECICSIEEKKIPFKSTAPNDSSSEYISHKFRISIKSTLKTCTFYFERDGAVNFPFLHSHAAVNIRIVSSSQSEMCME